MRKFAEIMVKGRIVICLLVFVIAGVFATFIPKVNINSDMTKYLADSSQMKKGMDIMDEEFSETEESQTIRVLFKGLKQERKEEIADELENIKYVDSISYDIDSIEYNKDEYTLYKISTNYEYNSKEETYIRNKIEEKYEDYNIIVKNNYSKAALPPSIIVMALVIMLIILFIMCRSWIEPFLFLFVIAIAVVINMGTNILRPSVSVTTNSIAAILQLALSMDYSIMLMNRYRQERKTIDNKSEAMINAIRYSFSSITSSAFTTFVGLMMMVFMSFKLGMDLGLVLAKGVLCSWFCILTVLPTVIILFDKVIRMTAKDSLHLPTDKVANTSYKLRKVMPIFFVMLFVASYIVQNVTEITFSMTLNDEITKIIPNSNTVVALYDNEDEDKIDDIARVIEKDKNVASVMSYPTTLGKENTAEDMADMLKDYTEGSDMDIDASMLGMLYYDYYKKGKLPSITISEFINFIADDVITNKSFASELDDEMIEKVDDMKQFADAKKLTKDMSISELAEFFDMKKDDLKSLFVLYYAENDKINTGKMTLQTFVKFVSEDVMNNKNYSSMFDSSTKKQINQLKTYVDAEKMTVKMTYEEAASLLGMDSETVKLLYVYYYSKQEAYIPGSMDISEFVKFLTEKVINNKAFVSQFDKNMVEQFGTMAAFTDKDKINKNMYSEKMSELLSMDKEMLDMVYVFYHGSKNVGSTTLTLSEFTNFIVEKVMKKEMLTGSFNESMKASITSINSFINVAMSGQKLDAAALGSILGIEESQVNGLLMLYSQGDNTKMTVTLSEFTNFLVTKVINDQVYDGVFTQEAKQSITMLNQLIQLAVSKTKLDSNQIASIMGIDKMQAVQLYVIYTGMYMEKKQMSPKELIEYLITAKESSDAIGTALSDDVVVQLKMLQNIMNLALSGKKFTYTELASVFSIDKDMMRMLYTLHDSYGNVSGWGISMQDIVNFLIENKSMFSSMMDASSIDKLNMAQRLINGAVSGTKYSVNDLASLLEIDKAQLKQLFLLYISQYGDTSKWKTSVDKLIDFLTENVLTNKDLSKMLDDDIKDMLDVAKTIVDAVISGKSYKSDKLLDLLEGLVDGLDKNIVELLYLYYGSVNDSEEEWTMSVTKLFNHLAGSVIKDERFDSFLEDDFKDNITDMQEQLDSGIEQLVGDNHSIMVITTIYPDESKETSDFIGTIHKVMNTKCESNYYLIGNSVMNYEMEQTFKKEMLFMTLLTAFSIFIIVLITFKSFVIPTILVLIVQSAVFITVSASGLRGQAINYLAYLIVQCILMGATIDYAILFTNYYLEKREKYDIMQALKSAYKGAIHTIFTSGLVLVTVTGIIGLFSGDRTIGPICITIALGTLAAIILILFVLPGTIAMCDRFVYKKKVSTENEQLKLEI